MRQDPKTFTKIELSDRAYPKNLRGFPDSPRLLYVKGDPVVFGDEAIAIVGARQMTDKGKKAAEEFCGELSKRGIVIISGLARGIDTIAHKTALEAHGKTIAVLGSGIDIIYPAENRGLAERITQDGAVVSQFPLGTKPKGENFLVRNRLIASLSRGILVIEGRAKSGTISTATHAANLGIDVFAFPGSEATDWLIGEGATAVVSPSALIKLYESNYR